MYQNVAPRFADSADQPKKLCGSKEFMVDGLLAKLGNGIVTLCSSLFATSLPVLSRTGSPPVAL